MISTKLSFVVRARALAREINSVVAKPSKTKTGCMCLMLPCLEGSRQNSHPTCPTISWWNHDEILVSLRLTTGHQPPSRQALALIMWLNTRENGRFDALLCWSMSCFLSLQVRTGLNQVEQVSSRFETCRNVVKMDLFEVTGRLELTCPVRIHQWTEKTSVPQRVIIIPPFPLDLMRRDLQVCFLCPRVLVRPPSSRLHLSADILFFPASDLRCGLERISLVGSVQEYFTPCWCHSWMELICIICCLKQHATICSVMQHAPTGQLCPRNAFAGTSRAAVGEVLIYSFQHQRSVHEGKWCWPFSNYRFHLSASTFRDIGFLNWNQRRRSNVRTHQLHHHQKMAEVHDDQLNHPQASNQETLSWR